MTRSDVRASAWREGLFVGLAVSGAVILLAVPACWLWARGAAREARKGWNLVPVIVAAVDLEGGELVTTEKVTQRAIPEQFVTKSVVKTDSLSYLVNQRILSPVAAGDPLLWSQFELRDSEDTTVVEARRALSVGTALSRDDVHVVHTFRVCTNETNVPGDALESVIGRTVTVPMLENEPLRITHLEK